MPPPEVLGPLGLTVAAVVTVIELWRAHKAADKRERDQTDAWRAIAEQGTENVTKLGAALDTRNRIDEERFREARGAR